MVTETSLRKNFFRYSSRSSNLNYDSLVLLQIFHKMDSYQALVILFDSQQASERRAVSPLWIFISSFPRSLKFFYLLVLSIGRKHFDGQHQVLIIFLYFHFALIAKNSLFLHEFFKIAKLPFFHIVTISLFALYESIQIVISLFARNYFNKKAFKLIISSLLLRILLDVNKLRSSTLTLRPHKQDLALCFLDSANLTDLFLFLRIKLLYLFQFRVDARFDKLYQPSQHIRKLWVDAHQLSLFLSDFCQNENESISQFHRQVS